MKKTPSHLAAAELERVKSSAFCINLLPWGTVSRVTNHRCGRAGAELPAELGGGSETAKGQSRFLLWFVLCQMKPRTEGPYTTVCHWTRAVLQRTVCTAGDRAAFPCLIWPSVSCDSCCPDTAISAAYGKLLLNCPVWAPSAALLRLEQSASLAREVQPCWLRRGQPQQAGVVAHAPGELQQQLVTTAKLWHRPGEYREIRFGVSHFSPRHAQPSQEHPLLGSVTDSC